MAVNSTSGTIPPKPYYGIEGLPSIVDAGLRAAGRYTEISFMKESTLVRLPWLVKQRKKLELSKS